MKHIEGKFLHPVRPGGGLASGAKVTELHPRHAPGESFVVGEIWCRNQDGVLVGAGKSSVRIPD